MGLKMKVIQLRALGAGLASLGYSLMTVVASAVKAVGPNPTRDSVRDALKRTKDVPVVVGTGKYGYFNRIPTYGTSFLMVKDGAFVPAPL